MAPLTLPTYDGDSRVREVADVRDRPSEPTLDADETERCAEPFQPARTEGGWRWIYLAPVFVADAAVAYVQCVAGELRRSRRGLGSHHG